MFNLPATLVAHIARLDLPARAPELSRRAISLQKLLPQPLVVDRGRGHAVVGVGLITKQPQPAGRGASQTFPKSTA